ncbi:MAG: ABC transporter substrate-binding protein [Geodermatophilaceae bacterium]
MNTSGGAGGGPIKVGLVIPQAGIYTPLGVDMQNAWELWLEQNDGMLGGYTVETVIADEGEGPDTGVPAIQGVLQNDQVDVLVGIVNSATALGAADAVTEAQKVLIISNAGAAAITGEASSPYIWRSSFVNAQVVVPMAEYLAGERHRTGVRDVGGLRGGPGGRGRLHRGVRGRQRHRSPGRC